MTHLVSSMVWVTFSRGTCICYLIGGSFQYGAAVTHKISRGIGYGPWFVKPRNPVQLVTWYSLQLKHLD